MVQICPYILCVRYATVLYVSGGYLPHLDERYLDCVEIISGMAGMFGGVVRSLMSIGIQGLREVCLH